MKQMTVRSIRNSYKFYRKNNGKLKHDEYIKLNNMFTDYIVKQIFDGRAIRIHNIGVISIIGKKQKKVSRDEKGRVVNRAINWKATNEYWNKNKEAKKNKKLIYYLNDHTNGIVYSFNYSKYKVYNLNFNTIKFRASRRNKRLLAKYIFNNEKEYEIKNRYEVY